MRVLIHKLKKQPSQPAAIPVSSQLKNSSPKNGIAKKDILKIPL